MKMSRQNQLYFFGDNTMLSSLMKLREPELSFDYDILVWWFYKKKTSIAEEHLEKMNQEAKDIFNLVVNQKASEVIKSLIIKHDVKHDQSKKVQAMIKLYKD